MITNLKDFMDNKVKSENNAICKDLILSSLKENKDVKIADSNLEQLIVIYKEKTKQKKKLEKELSHIKNHICLEMTDKFELVSLSGELLATWNWSKPVCIFDKNRFETEMPMLYEQYVAEGEPVRTFLVK